MVGFVVLSLLALSACDQSQWVNPDHTAIKLTGQTMGTVYQITLFPPTTHSTSHALDKKRPLDNKKSTDEKRQETGVTMTSSSSDSIQSIEHHPTIQQQIDQKLIEINKVMSTYSPDSELSRLNDVVEDHCIPLSAPLFELIALSKQIGKESSGFFDVTVGPAVDAWGFGPVEMDAIPTDQDIAILNHQIGDDAVLLESAPLCVRKKAPRRIDLSAIAKGYAVDELVGLLKSQGYQAFLVEIGGEIWAEGLKPNGQPWRIAVESPLKSGQRHIQRALSLHNIGVASSGDYRNYYEKAGKAYSHTINPHTAKPVDHSLVSATVLAKTVAEADAWATAFLAMGTVEALTIADRKKMPVLLVERSSENQLKEYQSEALEDFLIMGNDSK